MTDVQLAIIGKYTELLNRAIVWTDAKIVINESEGWIGNEIKIVDKHNNEILTWEGANLEKLYDDFILSLIAQGIDNLLKQANEVQEG
jgi:NADPH-dependent 2,4-dienoyl-CoA reductase/sulfur reductase-like enzyme